MSKFVFVCYDHACGGESLALKISQLPECHTLKYKKFKKRTVVDDVFDKELLMAIPTKPLQLITNTTDLFHVVPSHLPPETLQKFYPDSLYVIINFPKTQKGIRQWCLRKYRYFEMSVSETFVQRLGEYRDKGGDMTNTDNIKQIAKPMRNIQIRCLAKNLEPTKQNCKRVFFSSLKHTGMHYKTNKNIVACDFEQKDSDEFFNAISNLIRNYQ
jgi:hypothetical protein